MFLHRRQDTEVTLYPASIVVANVALNHLDQLLLACKPPAIGPLSIQCATLDILWGIPASTNLVWKVRLVYWNPLSLWSSGWVPRLGLHSLVEGLEYKRIVVVVTGPIRNDTPVKQIQDGAEVEFYSWPCIISTLSSIVILASFDMNTPPIRDSLFFHYFL